MKEEIVPKVNCAIDGTYRFSWSSFLSFARMSNCQSL